MRSLAARLEIGTMSLYTYVDSKAALVDLMIDRVIGFVPREPFGDQPWRERLERIARQQLENYLAHPWVLQVDLSRPPLGPGISDAYEYQLSAIEEIGLSDLDMDSVITVLGNHTSAAARSMIGAERVRKESGTSDLDWWQANAPVLDQVMDAARFPVSGRVGAAFGEHYQSIASPDHGFEFGLKLLLDGVERRVERA
jgi:AcrR family transcriptional regulator